MSDAVFPSLPGITWSIVKTPVFSTAIKKAKSGREDRIAYYDAPMCRWSIPFAFLRDRMTTQNPSGVYAELKRLMGFFYARRGRFDSFLFEDYTDHIATDQGFGTGDGHTRTFQLGRSMGAQFFEPIENIKGGPVVKISGVPTTAFTLGSTGIVTFSTAPAAGAALTWTGEFYYRCRFDTDEQDFTQMMHNIWEIDELPIYGALQNRI